MVKNMGKWGLGRKRKKTVKLESEESCAWRL